jgi:hypothetical protein
MNASGAAVPGLLRLLASGRISTWVVPRSTTGAVLRQRASVVGPVPVRASAIGATRERAEHGPQQEWQGARRRGRVSFAGI